jgi:hypothetical protein
MLRSPGVDSTGALGDRQGIHPLRQFVAVEEGESVAVIGVQFVERGNGDQPGLWTKGELEIAQLACRV